MLAPDPTVGRAGMRGGISPDGLPVIVKSWRRRKGVADLELEEIWRHELRQLHRLAGFPTASDFIARLQQAGHDESAFYLVLDPGQRRPLQVLLDEAPTGHWLKQPRAATNRVRIWRNLARASQGLETLHAQGLLHRNIDEWAVLTAGSDQPDFQLTGFEWSMRLTSYQSAKIKVVRGRSSDQHYSFQHDWLLLGLLAARLLSVNVNRLVDLRVAPSEIAEHINNSEAKLLRAIVHNDAGGRLSGDVVAQRISEVLRSLEAEIAALDPKFHLALRLGPGTPLAGRIRQASNEEIEMDDVDAQLQFVRNDLVADAPLLMALKRGASDTPRLVLRGKHLLYQLQQYVHQRGKSIPTWEFAYCDSVEPNSPAPVNILRQLPLDAKSLECMAMKEALEQFPSVRGKLSSWEQLQQQLVDAIAEPSREEIVHRALTLTQFLEVLYAAADVFPVEIVQGPASSLRLSGILRNGSQDGDEGSIPNEKGATPLGRKFVEIVALTFRVARRDGCGGRRSMTYSCVGTLEVGAQAAHRARRECMAVNRAAIFPISWRQSKYFIMDALRVSQALSPIGSEAHVASVPLLALG